MRKELAYSARAVGVWILIFDSDGGVIDCTVSSVL